MISLILPYWDRQHAADEALQLLARTYAGADLEVVVVDDGNAVPFVAPNVRLNLRVIGMPAKGVPLSPVTPWNCGVEQAAGDLICISCIEVLHRQPVLQAMEAALERLGPSGIVLAAAWCPDLNEWHCHSTNRSRGAPPVPEGTGRPFCALMHKDFYLDSGGFDEDFREGAGYEDMDWINRMLRASARFQIRDDLVVEHPKRRARIDWPAGAFERNERIYQEKWAC